MSDPVADIREAEARAAQAKERLTDNLHKLQVKLNPKTIARDAARSAADKGQAAATSGLDFVKDNPAPVAGAVAVTGLLLFRKKLWRLIRRKKSPPPRARRAPRPPADHED